MHVSRKMTSFPRWANIRMRHFLKFRISAQTSSSAFREETSISIGTIQQCPSHIESLALGRAR